jgi:hypothetical protein
MASAEEIMDSYSGMISKSDAERLANSTEGGISQVQSTNVMGAKAVLETLSKQGKASKLIEVDVQDEIYRIFNQSEAKEGSPQSRVVVLGKEGETITMELRGRLSLSIDFGKFERGDTILISRVLLDTKKSRLVSFTDTTISRIKRSAAPDLELKSVNAEMRNVDVSGKVVMIAQPREIPRIGGKGNITVLDCTISQESDSADVTFWGISAHAFLASNPGIGDAIRIEFCSIKPIDGRLRIVANDSSRILLLRRGGKPQATEG